MDVFATDTSKFKVWTTHMDRVSAGATNPNKTCIATDFSVFADELKTLNGSDGNSIYNEKNSTAVTNFNDMMKANPKLKEAIMNLDENNNGEEITPDALRKLSGQFQESKQDLSLVNFAYSSDYKKSIDADVLTDKDITEFAKKNNIDIQKPINNNYNSQQPITPNLAQSIMGDNVNTKEATNTASDDCLDSYDKQTKHISDFTKEILGWYKK